MPQTAADAQNNRQAEHVVSVNWRGPRGKAGELAASLKSLNNDLCPLPSPPDVACIPRPK